MKNQNILTVPNPILRQKSQEISNFDETVLTIYENLKILLEQQKDPEGLGLSAPQIGQLRRIFVARIGKNVLAFINPKISQVSKEKTTTLEGCLSVPLYYGEVARPKEIDITFCDLKGKIRQRHFKGISATIIQHETDHLNGILFTDHLQKQKGKLYKVVGKDNEGQEKLAEVKYDGK